MLLLYKVVYSGREFVEEDAGEMRDSSIASASYSGGGFEYVEESLLRYDTEVGMVSTFVDILILSSNVEGVLQEYLQCKSCKCKCLITLLHPHP